MTPEWQPWADEAWDQPDDTKPAGPAVMITVGLASLIFAGGIVVLTVFGIRSILRHVAGGL